MPTLSRRRFLQLASALGATLAWGCATVHPSKSGWRERRDLYPQGVASGDPDADSVLVWTRRPYADGRDAAKLLWRVASAEGACMRRLEERMLDDLEARAWEALRQPHRTLTSVPARGAMVHP